MGSIQLQPLSPFLKWAGGKRWLAPKVALEIGVVHGNYIEPFLGGGAVYFALRPDHAILSDVNADLIDTYRVVKRAWRVLTTQLVAHQRLHSATHYYHVRGRYPSSQIERAARFIYLNRTCWNGLYRVNLDGQFNVPLGTKTKVLEDVEEFGPLSRTLQSATLRVADFQIAIDAAERGDVIFADPPYTVRHKFNGFIKYNECLFSWDDQMRLRESLAAAKQRGARIFLTNADHESIRKLYARDFKITEMARYSAISGTGGSRGNFAELLITD
jgi:DNA adenine methylase